MVQLKGDPGYLPLVHGLAKKMKGVKVKIIRESLNYDLIASQVICIIHKHKRYKQRKASRLSKRQSSDVQTNLFYIGSCTLPFCDV